MQFKGIPYIEILKSKLFKGAVIISLFLGILVYIYSLTISDLTFFPNNDYLLNVYNDSANGGNSQIISNEVTDSLFKIGFELKNAIGNPYVGIGIARKDLGTFNISKYNQFEIKAKGHHVNGLGIAIYTSNPNPVKNPNLTEILVYSTFHINSEKNSYNIKLNHFKSPDWWIEFNNVNDDIKPDFKNVKNINISNAFSPDFEKTKTVEIYSVSFSRNNKTLLFQILVVEFIIVIMVLVIYISVERSRKRKKTVTITYKPVESELKKMSKSDFMDYINNHFHNSQLTLDIVASETGISQRKIASNIQEQFNCNFKTYINRLRINESKRLLVDANLNIGEIAYKVGFNNQSHFNRVFKTELNISPTEFRDKKK